MAKDYAKSRNSRSQPPETGGSWRWLLALILIALFAALVLFLKQQSIKMAEEQTNKATATTITTSSNKTAQTHSTKTETLPSGTKASLNNTVSNKIGASQAGGPPQPRFDFYTMLPQGQKATMQNTQQHPPATTPTPPPPPTTTSVTQTNSTTTQPATPPVATKTTAPVSSTTKSDNKRLVAAETAQFLQSELSEMNHDVTTKKATPAPVVYALELGIFKTYAEADTLKAQLTLQGIEVKIKTVKQNNTTLYRVFTGPYPEIAAARKAQRALLNNQVKSKILAVH